MTKPTHSQFFELQLEITINRPPEDVWTALTEGIGLWWPAEFYAGGEEGNREIRLEAKPGGGMVETWSAGGGLLWATVVNVEPGKRLQVTGTTFPQWGGPSIWLGTWELEAATATGGSGARTEHAEHTVLRFIENVLAANDETRGDRLKGWNYLFGGALKAHVEGREKPAWDEWEAS